MALIKERMEKKPLIYLAAPYSHKDPFIIENRYVEMFDVMAKIINEQDAVIPYSPINSTHRISKDCDPDFNWYEWDLQYLVRCDGMIVVMLEGWEESKGVSIEIEFCKEQNIPYVLSTPDQILGACEWILKRNLI